MQCYVTLRNEQLPSFHVSCPTLETLLSSSPTLLFHMSWHQSTFKLPAKPRGCHIVTADVVSALPIDKYEVGVLTLFIKHTSAGLTLNENWDSDVGLDLATALDRMAPEGSDLYRHNDEGPDDMPAHVKATIVGAAVTIPIARGKLALGTWQGIHLVECRNRGGSRTLVGTINGQLYA